MLSRIQYADALTQALGRSPVVALLGPRQCGKTTLARHLAAEHIDGNATFFDLESPIDLGRLENPLLALRDLRGLVVLDEVQHRPKILETLRVLADRDPLPARFLILGSASTELVRHSSESLAGRVEFVDLGGFDMDEVGVERRGSLWIRGGFPRSFLARTEEDSAAWRESFVRTFLERDIPLLGFQIPPVAMRRFWTMLAHYHGQTWNASEISRSFGISDKTARSYLDLLSGTFMVRQLQPWFENVGKRQVRSPKIYLRDSGLVHTLLSLPDEEAVLAHPKCGASWEGFALEQILRRVGPGEPYFWATHGGAELDLLLFQKGRPFGVEFKRADAPKTTRSMRIALEALQLEHLWVVYPGEHGYPLDEKITVVPLDRFPSDLCGTERVSAAAKGG